MTEQSGSRSGPVGVAFVMNGRGAARRAAALAGENPAGAILSFGRPARVEQRGVRSKPVGPTPCRFGRSSAPPSRSSSARRADRIPIGAGDDRTAPCGVHALPALGREQHGHCSWTVAATTGCSRSRWRSTPGRERGLRDAHCSSCARPARRRPVTSSRNASVRAPFATIVRVPPWRRRRATVPGRARPGPRRPSAAS